MRADAEQIKASYSPKAFGLIFHLLISSHQCYNSTHKTNSGKYPVYLPTDINGDGITDFNDITILESNNILGTILITP
jgi:hypothetical protein